jgi:hypothetical protein
MRLEERKHPRWIEAVDSLNRLANIFFAEARRLEGAVYLLADIGNCGGGCRAAAAHRRRAKALNLALLGDKAGADLGPKRVNAGSMLRGDLLEGTLECREESLRCCPAGPA